jgi:hypothetical protein
MTSLKKKMDKTALAGNKYVTIEISSGPGIVPCFGSIFQDGFFFPCEVGKSIEDLLFQQLALDRRFIEEKVNTVFLDGKCVDDISSAILKDGSVAAFSSALPGLAGATLRMGGIYACLRDSITYKQTGRAHAQREGLITIKLFNLLIMELGRIFLKKGIVLNHSTAVELFNSEHEGFWRQAEVIRVGDMPSSSDKLFEDIELAVCDRIMVRVIMTGDPDSKDRRST